MKGTVSIQNLFPATIAHFMAANWQAEAIATHKPILHPRATTPEVNLATHQFSMQHPHGTPSLRLNQKMQEQAFPRRKIFWLFS